MTIDVQKAAQDFAQEVQDLLDSVLPRPDNVPPEDRERGTVSWLLSRTNPSHPGALSALHFPVGGARMRPCLEDFLQFLRHEFKIDVLLGAKNVLLKGRERWRRRQIGALVRNAPDEAVRVLKENVIQNSPSSCAPDLISAGQRTAVIILDF